MSILNGAVEITRNSQSDIIDWLGRKSLMCRAKIPDDIFEAETYIRKVDTERVALEKYAPKVSEIPWFETAIFKNPYKDIFSSLPHPTLTLDIEEINDICRISPNPSFEPLWAILNQDYSYPVRPITRPSDPLAPPSWSPWRFEIPEPVFEPPLYEGRLSILNRFVYAAYKDESDRVVAARASKVEIEEAAIKRNAQMKQLAAKAENCGSKPKLRKKKPIQQQCHVTIRMPRNMRNASAQSNRKCVRVGN